MKNIVLVIAILTLASCDLSVEPSTDLIGSWTWVQSSGGFAGRTDTPSSTGDVITIEFSKSQYKKYVNGTLKETLSYSIQLEESIYSQNKVEVISFSNGWKQSFSTDGNSLILSDECYDCFQSEYVKKQLD